MPLNSITKNGLILTGFALVTTGLIAITFDGTKQRIDEQRAKKKLATLMEPSELSYIMLYSAKTLG